MVQHVKFEWMKNQYRINIQADKNLGDEVFAQDFLHAWLKGNPKLRPERFDHGEPTRKSIEDADFENLLMEWQTPPSLMFKRISAPKFVAEVKWRQHKGKDPRPYPWGIMRYPHKAWLI